jgi:hypothetical protein
MTAGKGVLHSEMPEQESGLLHGFQLWLNLPAAEKLKPAAYQDIRSTDIPFINLDAGGKVAVIAGDVDVNKGTVLQGVLPILSTQPVMMDVTLNAHESLSLDFNSAYPALVYVCGGKLEGESDIEKGTMGVFSAGDSLSLTAGETGANLLILSGKPIKEPIVQYGPFVMNTRAEIDQAINEFRTGRFL